MNNTTPLPSPALRVAKACAQLIEATGVPAARARRTADVLVLAELWGISSHGLLRLPHYLRRLAAGGSNPRAELTTVHDAGPLLVLDGGAGLGHWQAWEAAERAATRAKEHGIALVAVGNSGHCGALGTYALPGMEEGLLTLIFSNGPAVMPAWGASTPLLSTSPLAAGISGIEDDAVVDLATTAVARGKIAAHAASGTELPEGWALDSAGAPTTDPVTALHGMLAPLGGAKGFALALVVECLTGGLTGPSLSTEVADMFDPEDDHRPQGIAHLLLSLDPSRLDSSGDPDASARRIQGLFDAVTDGGGRVPGSRRASMRHVGEGQLVTIPTSVRADLENAAADLGVSIELS